MKKEEVLPIFAAIIVMTGVLSLYNKNITWNENGVINGLILLFYSFLIISISVLAKKLEAHLMDIEIRHSIWKFQRYWFTRNRKFKTPIPAGIIFPLIFSFFSEGYIKFLAFLQYDSFPTTARVARKSRHRFRLYEPLDWEIGKIAFAGLLSTLTIALISDYFNFVELAKISLFYSIANLIPFSQIDGLKIFFGSTTPLEKDFGSSNPTKRTIPSIPLFLFSIILTVIVGLVVYF